MRAPKRGALSRPGKARDPMLQSRTTSKFWECYDRLPQSVRKQADRAYKLFSENAYHPSLQFKSIRKATKPVFSVRINDDCRALGVREDDVIVWFWIGSHSAYEALLKRINKT